MSKLIGSMRSRCEPRAKRLRFPAIIRSRSIPRYLIQRLFTTRLEPIAQFAECLRIKRSDLVRRKVRASISRKHAD